MRSILLLAGITLSHFAQASFEMLMVLDSDSTNGLHVDRFDPITGASLGTILQNTYPNITAIEANKSRGELYCNLGGVVAVHDYSTGIYKAGYTWGASIGGIFLGANNNLYGFSGSTLRRMNVLTGVVSTMTSPSTSIRFFNQTSSGLFLLGDGITGSLFSSLDGTTWTNRGSVLMPTTLTDSVVTRALSVPSEDLLLYGSTTGTSYMFLNPSSGVVASNSTYFDGSISVGRGYAAAHGGAYLLSDSPTLATDVIRHMNANGNNGALMTPSNLTNTRWMTSVVAPEPASLLALAGLAFFAKRKRA